MQQKSQILVLKIKLHEAVSPVFPSCNSVALFLPGESPYVLCWCLSSAGAVLYRIPLTWGQNKLPWKLLHAALMLIALILSIVGLYAVFDFHNTSNIPNLYSLHSWIGIAAAALFAIQVRRLKCKDRVI